MKYSIVSFLFVLLVGACQNEPTVNEPKGDDALEVKTDTILENSGTMHVEKSETTSILTEKEAFFKCTADKDGDNPKSSIAVNLNNKLTTLGTFAGECQRISKSDFKSKEIPTEAIDGCGTWWAGAGDYFYLIQKGSNLEIYQGWQDEEQEGESYHWKMIKSINIP
jgi:hypothetical protein